jgi:hypothetical protein
MMDLGLEPPGTGWIDPTAKASCLEAPVSGPTVDGRLCRHQSNVDLAHDAGLFGLVCVSGDRPGFLSGACDEQAGG